MKRYDFQPGYTCNEDCHAEMIENLTGDYILFDDYKILRLKYVETLTRTEKAEAERDALKKQIENKKAREE